MATATKSKKKAATGLKLQPLGDRVVVRREEAEETTSGGIVLPGSAKEKPARGYVVSVGDGKLLDNGERAQIQVKEGDHVIFSSYAGEQFEVSHLIRKPAKQFAAAFRQTGPRRQGHAGSQRTKRDSAKELRLAHRDQRRRDRGQGN